MKGAEHIIEMRRQGRMPAHVTLALPGFQQINGQPLEHQIWIERGDVPGLVDLRCLIGLRVVVIGGKGSLAQVEKWAKAACDAGALNVGIAIHSREDGLDGPVWVRMSGENIE